MYLGSLESSERIRRQQKELIQLIQRSNQVSQNLSSNNSITSDISIMSQHSHPTMDYTHTPTGNNNGWMNAHVSQHYISPYTEHTTSSNGDRGIALTEHPTVAVIPEGSPALPQANGKKSRRKVTAPKATRPISAPLNYETGSDQKSKLNGRTPPYRNGVSTNVQIAVTPAPAAAHHTPRRKSHAVQDTTLQKHVPAKTSIGASKQSSKVKMQASHANILSHGRSPSIAHGFHTPVSGPARKPFIHHIPSVSTTINAPPETAHNTSMISTNTPNYSVLSGLSHGSNRPIAPALTTKSPYSNPRDRTSFTRPASAPSKYSR